MPYDFCVGYRSKGEDLATRTPVKVDTQVVNSCEGSSPLPSNTSAAASRASYLNTSTIFKPTNKPFTGQAGPTVLLNGGDTPVGRFELTVGGRQQPRTEGGTNFPLKEIGSYSTSSFANLPSLFVRSAAPSTWTACRNSLSLSSKRALLVAQISRWQRPGRSS